MKASPLRFRPLAAAILCSMIAPLTPSLFAQTTATTDPVGFITVSLAGNSDSYCYAPFKRTPAFAAAASGTIGSVNANEIPVTGTPFVASQFVYVAGTQPNRYYVFLNSGPKAGSYYSITGNTTSGITIDPNGDTLASAIVNGTTFQVIPYDTFGTVFPGGQGVNGSSSHSGASRLTEILIPDNSTAGIDLAAATSYYYYTGVAGVGPGWRKAGVTGTIANDDVILPDTYFIVRHNVPTGTSLTYMGTVQMAQLATPIGTILPNTDQDNAVALPVASDLTLAQTKLFETGVFVGSSSHSGALRQDVLLVWDNGIAGINKAADRSYYYYSGVAGVGPGWRLAGQSGTIVNDTVVSSTSGIAIRKKGTPTPSTVIWAFKPPYVP